MKVRSYVVLVGVAVLAAPTVSWAATLTCLTGTDPSVANDLGEITAVRADVDAACPCASPGQTHAQYVTCASGVISAQVGAGHLRTQCKATVRKYYSVSTCGVPTSKDEEPCIKKATASGKVSCAVKPVAKCVGSGAFTQKACPNATLCIDAADTNGDGIIGSGDSGACAPCVVGTGTGASCTEAALTACLPGGGSFVRIVTFNCGGAATITVTSTKTISANTSIDGGSLITISGGDSVGVFSVNTGVNFTVQNLTIANGSAGFGGGIVNFGTVTVANSTFSGNSASQDGGGVYTSAGTLTVTNSTFSGNTAPEGGGIFNGDFSYNGAFTNGTVTIANSTFSGNTATDNDGGGIANVFGTVTIANSTFSGNSANIYGGGIANEGTLTVTNSTFSGNSARFGGGIPNVGFISSPGTVMAGTVTITNTIIANSPSGTNCCSVFPCYSVTDRGHNIADDGSCGFSGTSLSGTKPKLDPAGLANNGGPTQTIALQAGSPAINAGDEAVCAAPPLNNLDQRGYVRPGSGATNCSIGAFEANAAP